MSQANTTDSVESSLLLSTHTADPQLEGDSSQIWRPGSHGAPDRRTAWIYPLQQPDLRWQDSSQQSSASCIPPPQDMMHTSTLDSHPYDVKGSDVSMTNEMQACFWQTESMQAAHRSSLNSHLLDDGQSRAVSKDGIIVPTESFGGEALVPHPLAEFADGPVQYYPTFPDAYAIFTREALDMRSDSRAEASTVHYFPTYLQRLTEYLILYFILVRQAVWITVAVFNPS